MEQEGAFRNQKGVIGKLQLHASAFMQHAQIGRCQFVFDIAYSRIETRASMCRYEGEFRGGFAHGLGVYTAADGQVYRGEFLYGKKHGCVSR